MKKQFGFYSEIVLFFFFAFAKNGQEKQPADTLANALGRAVAAPVPEKKVRKNTILINATNPVLVSDRFVTMAYERVLPNNQTFSIAVGSFSIPKFVNGIGDSLGVESDVKERGLHISADYRFYLKKENLHGAPRGVYIGPYYAYNHMNRDVTWFLDGKNFNGDVNSELKLSIHTLGFELGYQFIFWDRLAVDMILFGPGFGSYKLNNGLITTLTPDQESEFFEKLNQYLEENVPGYDYVIEPGEFVKNGSFKTWELGYRYTIRVGFRF